MSGIFNFDLHGGVMTGAGGTLRPKLAEHAAHNTMDIRGFRQAVDPWFLRQILDKFTGIQQRNLWKSIFAKAESGPHSSFLDARG